MAITQSCRHAFFAAAAELRLIAIATTCSGGLRAIAKNAASTSALLHLGFLRLFAGRHIHAPRGRNARRIPAWKHSFLGIRTRGDGQPWVSRRAHFAWEGGDKPRDTSAVNGSDGADTGKVAGERGAGLASV